MTLANHFPVFQQVAELIGSQSTLKLMAEWGGTKVYVPKDPKPSSALVKCIGIQAAEKLAPVYGGEHILVPNGKIIKSAELHRRVREASQQPNTSQPKLARQFNLHERQIRRIQKADPHPQKDSRQNDLFDANNKP